MPRPAQEDENEDRLLSVRASRTGARASGLGGQIILIGVPVGVDITQRADRLAGFVQLSGGRNGRLLVIPAPAPDSIETGRRYARVLIGLGAGMVSVLHITERAHAGDVNALELLNQATGILLVGDDPSRLAHMLGATAALDTIVQRNQGGAVIGAAGPAMSVLGSSMCVSSKNTAIDPTGGAELESPTQLAAGLDLLPQCIVHPHIDRRLAALAAAQQLLALQLDSESAAFIDSSGRLIAHGPATIELFDARRSQPEPSGTGSKTADRTSGRSGSIVLSSGEEYDLRTGVRLPRALDSVEQNHVSSTGRSGNAPRSSGPSNEAAGPAGALMIPLVSPASILPADSRGL